MSYSRKTFLLIVIATVIRCITACSVELGNDEVYYRILAEHLQWNYFDHPPMVAWLIRLTTANLWLDTELFIRLGAILSAAASTWFIYLTGKKIGNGQTGFTAAAIYTASLYGSIIAGTFILPDSPQMVCWTAGLYLLTGITASNHIRRRSKRNLLLFGIVAGIGMLCKIHTAFLWLGFGLYVILYNRKWLKEPLLYLSGLITLLFFYPVIRWNIDNHFITFLYHSNRVNIAQGTLDMPGFFTFAAGQVFYCNPVIFICILVALVGAFRNRLPISISQKRLLLLTSLPLILIATAISLFKNVLPHWTGPAYSGLILLTACYFGKGNKSLQEDKKLLPWPVFLAGGLQVLVIILAVLSIHFIPGTLGKTDPKQMGDGDFTLDMYGWKRFAVSFDSIYQINRRGQQPGDKTAIISNKWFPAAHINYYVANPLKLKVYTPGTIADIHQYKWINEEQGNLHDSTCLYVIIPSNYYTGIEQFPFLKNKKAAAVYTISQERNGKEAREFNIYYFSKDSFSIR